MELELLVAHRSAVRFAEDTHDRESPLKATSLWRERASLMFDRYDHKSTLLERGLLVYDQSISIFIYILRSLKWNSFRVGEMINRTPDLGLTSAEPTGGGDAPSSARWLIILKYESVGAFRTDR